MKPHGLNNGCAFLRIWRFNFKRPLNNKRSINGSWPISVGRPVEICIMEMRDQTNVALVENENRSTIITIQTYVQNRHENTVQ